MIDAASFIAAARARGFGLYSGVPCSYLSPFLNAIAGAPGLRYVGAANEGDAVAIAAGARLGGLGSVAMFQNSGLGNAVNPLTSLTHTFRIPVLLVVTWRGEPGGAADEPQHELMGQITPALLDTMGIGWAAFPASAAELVPVLEAAVAHLERTGRPFALVMRKGSVVPAAAPPAAASPSTPLAAVVDRPAATARRQDLLMAVQAAASPDDIVIATTGYTGRELCALEDRDNQLYMVGSMGCASSLGLGLALARPDRRVIVLDGDGALLMRLGALAILGHERPPNLLHVLIDNGLHESTGGQATVSAGVDLATVATACGYPTVLAAGTPAALAAAVADRRPGLRFVYAPVRPGVMANLPRPERTPAEVAARLTAALGASPLAVS